MIFAIAASNDIPAVGTINTRSARLPTPAQPPRTQSQQTRSPCQTRHMHLLRQHRRHWLVGSVSLCILRLCGGPNAGCQVSAPLILLTVFRFPGAQPEEFSCRVVPMDRPLQQRGGGRGSAASACRLGLVNLLVLVAGHERFREGGDRWLTGSEAAAICRKLVALLSVTRFTAMEGAQYQILLEGKVRRVKKVLPGGTEVLEEWDAASDTLLLRRTRIDQGLGRFTDWVVEVGLPPPTPASQQAAADLCESSANPSFSRNDSAESFVFRVRNLHLPPPESASVFVDDDTDEIVVRTSNRKYYKRFAIPDLRRLKLRLQDENLRFEYSPKAFVLVISYRKPHRLLEVEAIETSYRSRAKRDGDVVGI